jgi:hypothetical protein
MVARGETSGRQDKDFCALKTRHKAEPRLQGGKPLADDSRRCTPGYLLFAASRRIRISKYALRHADTQFISCITRLTMVT